MPSTLRATLLSAALLDELTFGFLTIALPLLRDRYHLTYDEVGLLFTAGAVSSLLIEPAINLVSDRGSKRTPILLGAVVLALAFALAGVASSYPLLILAFGAIWPATGAATDLPQAALVDAAPAAATGIMTRWTLLSGIGDLLSPLAIGALTALAFGWPALCAVAAALWLAFAALIACQRLPRPVFAHAESSAAAEPGILAGVRAALRDRTLLRWMAVVLLADMMDEVFLAFAGLYLRDRLHLPPGLAGVALGANLAGGLAALVILDRLAGRLRTPALLSWLAVLASGGVALLLLAPAPWVAVAGLFLSGVGAAGWYPLAKARAYEALPGRSGTVRALLGLGEPYQVALPAIVGLIASRWGIGPALAFLGISGIGVLVVAPRREGAPVAPVTAAR